MRKKRLLCITLMLVIFNSFLFSVQPSVAQSETIIFVSPEMIAVEPGGTFELAINIERAENVYSWQFVLSWDPTILEVQDVVEGSFLNQRIYKTIFQDYINNEAGNLTVVCVLRGEPRESSAKGEGTLATITFNVKAKGYTLLHLHDTMMLDYDLLKLPHTTEDGYFQYGVEIPSLKVDLSSVVGPLSPGFSFNVSITIANVTDLFGWTVCLSWDPLILGVEDVQEGSFLSQNGTQATAFNWTHLEAGVVCVNSTLIDQPPVTADGNGTLVIIAFSVEHYGDTLIDLHNTTLLDSNLMEIPHLIEDASFTNVIGDIAVKSIEASIYNGTAGDTVSITVIVENEGNVIVPFDILVWANITLIRIIPVTDLGASEQRTLTLDWNTQNVAEGRYVIRAEADIIAGETDTADNTLVMTDVVHITVQSTKQSSMTPVIAAAIAIVVIAVILFYFIRRKRSSKK